MATSAGGRPKINQPSPTSTWPRSITSRRKARSASASGLYRITCAPLIMLVASWVGHLRTGQSILTGRCDGKATVSRSPPRTGARRDGGVVGPRDGGHDGQTQAGPFLRSRSAGVQTAERLEQLVDPILWYLRSGVADAEGPGARDPDLDLAPRTIVTDGVLKQV